MELHPYQEEEGFLSILYGLKHMVLLMSLLHGLDF